MTQDGETATDSGVTDVRVPNGELESASTKAYPMLEVARHMTRSSCWFVVGGKVYDATPFLDEHPGGDDILLDTAGRDATREFEDVGHSDGARRQLDDLYIGDLRDATPAELEAVSEEEKLRALKGNSGGQDSLIVSVAKYLLPVLLAVLAYVIRKYTK